MAGFLTTDQLSGINATFDTLHTTFAKTITIYKNSTETIIQSPRYNSVYGRTNTGQTSIQHVEVSSTFEARVYYIDRDQQVMAYSDATPQRIIMSDGTVKIIVQQAGFDYLVESRRVEFDGNRFTIKSDGVPHGLGSNKFYTFFLKPTDE
jgi:hypothetical protein|tara:strand:- start:1888 stop:2337 length:450 start_codon:yes stop_codon:yes gene_type:complete